MEVQPKPSEPALRQHGRMADIMTTILTTGGVNAKAPILACKSAEPSSPPPPREKPRPSLPKRKQPPPRKEIDSSDDDSSDEDEAKEIKKDSAVVKSSHMLPAAASLDLERKLQRIATRGVVELFNAVSKQQKEIEAKLEEAGGSERKKTKVLSTVSKGSFIGLLKGSKKKGQQAQHHQNPDQDSKQTQDEGGAERDGEGSKPSWNVLSKDFMMGSKLRDWDKSQGEEATADGGEQYASSMESE